MTFKQSFQRNMVKATSKAWIKAFEDVIPVYIGSFELDKTVFLRATKERGQAKIMAKYDSKKIDGYNLRLLYTEKSGKITFKIMHETVAFPDAITVVSVEQLAEIVQKFEQQEDKTITTNLY